MYAAATLPGGAAAVRHLLEAGLPCKVVRAVIAHEDMGTLFHYRPGGADRGAGRTKPGNCAAPAVPPVHDRRVELDMTVEGKDAAAPGIEAAILLEHPRGRLDRVKRAAIAGEDR